MKEIHIDLASLPERPRRTMLEPYSTVIEELLARGWGYRDIARILGEQFGVSTSKSSLARLVQRKRSWQRTKEPSPGGAKLPPRALEERTEFHFDLDQPLRLKGK